MQITGLHRNIYKLSSYALSWEKREQQRKQYEKPVHLWQTLKASRVSDAVCQETLGISRATFYRHKAQLKRIDRGLCPPSRKPKQVRKPSWGEAEKQLVLHLRRANPTYGKAKIVVLLKRDHGLTLSESTVGRILKYLKQKGLITLSLSAPRQKRKRRFKGHAQPWRYGMKSLKPGQRVQIDHMTVTRNGLSAKHFQAWDPGSKFIHANVYSNAKSSTAKKFLLELLQKAPFPVFSIQVDGGSEFRKEFEQACQDFGIQLFVLPPKRPQYNGGVERGNRTFREEFYANPYLTADSLGALRPELQKALHKYNTYRPHFNLNGLTPMHYIHLSSLEASC